jgi:class 3 adenylate cyclase
MGRVSESSASATRAIVQAIGEILTLRAKTFDAGAAQHRFSRQMTATRRLAAILAADLAGYSCLIAADEDGTLQTFKAIRKDLFDPTGAGSTFGQR